MSKGQTGWEAAYAEEFLNLGRGNCYSFSATYCLLARELGLPAYTVVGGLGASNSPHGWVEMELDGHGLHVRSPVGVAVSPRLRAHRL